MAFDKKKKNALHAIPRKHIAVIGGGCAGMCAVAMLKEESLEPTCFEMTDKPGGTWCYRESAWEGVGSIMPNTIINHSKEMGAFSNFPPAKEYSNYMRHFEVYQYFMDYWIAHDCLRHVRVNMQTLEVKRTNDYDRTGRWSVTVMNTITKEISTEVYDGVLVCVGHINRPKMASFPGQENFKGKIVHTHSFKTVDEYKGKSVVVVGTGCSALDAANESAMVAKQVYMSTKSGAFIMPRLGPNGYPTDATLLTRFYSNNLQVWPRNLCNKFLEKSILDANFDKKMYAVPPKYKYLSRSPIINDDIFVKLLSGSVVQKNNIEQVTEDGVVFMDEGKVTEADVIVMATGYTWKFPFLEEGIVRHEQRKFFLYKHMYPPHLKHSTLAIIGFMYPLGPGFPIVELQSRLAARVLSGHCHLPSEKVMNKDIDKKFRLCLKKFAPDDKMMLRTDYLETMDEMANMIGVKPNMWKIFFSDPRLYHVMMFGPSVSYQYRLTGPHKWEGARRAILDSRKRFLYPLQHNRLKKKST